MTKGLTTVRRPHFVEDVRLPSIEHLSTHTESPAAAASEKTLCDMQVRCPQLRLWQIVHALTIAYLQLALRRPADGLAK